MEVEQAKTLSAQEQQGLTLNVIKCTWSSLTGLVFSYSLSDGK
jgi:hypothetical protein